MVLGFLQDLTKEFCWILLNEKIIMIFQYDWGTPFYSSSIDLRNAVLRKPLGLKFEPNELVKERYAFHFGLFNDCFSIIACLYLIPEKKYLHLKQMAVIEKLQGKGFGKQLILEVEKEIYYFGYNTILLHARATALGFYKKMGYKIISDKFEEVGIAHYKMRKKIKFFKKTH